MGRAPVHRVLIDSHELIAGGRDMDELDGAGIQNGPRGDVSRDDPDGPRGLRLGDGLEIEEADHGQDHERQEGPSKSAAAHDVLSALLPPKAGSARRLTWTGARRPRSGTGRATARSTSTAIDRGSAAQCPGRWATASESLH